MLGKIAAAKSLKWQPTLTGFKWISRVPGIVFGYEEALGYCVDPDYVRDKDGISACLKLSQMAAELKAQGHSLWDTLDNLALEHGLHATSPLTVRVEDLSIISKSMDILREQGLSEMAGSPVVETRDLAVPTEELPATNGMLFRNEHSDRVVIRPSGTEPKLKCYLEVIVPVETAAELPSARAEAARRLEAIKADLRAVLGLD